ncbi:hypothetical protein [Fortiea contorta]|uniref:hypothetical protein n=1 Tax=Fortiea contorta TaxID=1892405 RepID=UPI00034D9BE5|nr:hypothetical protein [Fortiea contorta]
MVAIFSKATTTTSAIAYQDSESPNQFLYYPLSVDLALGENLQDFKVTYWGIGKPFFVKIGNRVDSIVGAILAGRAKLDITAAQKQELTQKIRQVFGVQNPQLKPMSLTNVKVKPVIGTNTLQLGKDSDITFPSTVQLATSFNYLVGTGKNSLFAQFVATQNAENKVLANPSFGINIEGDAEFQGDPWTVEVEADLSQVWSYVRKRASASVKLGWFTFKLGDYDKIIQDLQREQIIKITYKEGSPETEKYGRQIFEMGKQIFEEVNKRINSQSGFFKFEPNRVPESRGSSASGFNWGWNFSVNLAYSHQAIKSTQSMRYKATVSYSGRFKKRVPSAMSLAVSCNSASSSLFQDLGNVSEPCITQAKIDEMNNRLEEEFNRKQRLLEALELRFATGEITEEQYRRAVDIITNGTTSASLMIVPTEQKLLAIAGSTSFEPEEYLLRSVNDLDLDEIIAEAIASEAEESVN